MRIQSLAHYQSIDIKSRVLKEKPRIDSLSKNIQDTYEPFQPEARGDLIKAIKKRISSGFYNTDTVLEDLGDSFAKALNQAT
jgi:anti-sigma28 factor (negative regulator of flagellin synthesis)